jgi:hypothetical protein
VAFVSYIAVALAAGRLLLDASGIRRSTSSGRWSWREFRKRNCRVAARSRSRERWLVHEHEVWQSVQPRAAATRNSEGSERPAIN